MKNPYKSIGTRRLKMSVYAKRIGRRDHSRKLYCPKCGNNIVDDLIELRSMFFCCRRCGYEFDADIHGVNPYINTGGGGLKKPKKGREIL